MSKTSTGYYNLKCDWIDTGAYLYQEGNGKDEAAPWQWNGIFLSPKKVRELASKAYKERVLHAMADDPGGVTLDHCQRMSEELGDHLDIENLVDHPYHLEVSSPGLDRPLTREADFTRFAGRPARISTREAVAGQRDFRGRLAGLDGRAIVLEQSDGQRVAIPYDLILKARLEPEF